MSFVSVDKFKDIFEKWYSHESANGQGAPKSPVIDGILFDLYDGQEYASGTETVMEDRYVMRSLVWCSDVTTNVRHESVLPISLPTSYPRLIAKSGMTFNYPNFSELLLVLCDINDGIIDTGMTNSGRTMLRAFINTVFGSMFNDSTNLYATNDNGSVPLRDSYYRLISNILEFVSSSGYYIYYLDTDELFVDAKLFDDKVRLMMLKRIIDNALGSDIKFNLDEQTYIFFGRKKYVVSVKSSGFFAATKHREKRLSDNKVEVDGFKDRIFLKIAGKSDDM